VSEPFPIQPVRKAYEQVYDQLRELIVSGQIPRGARLPNEAALAREFAVEVYVPMWRGATAGQ